MDEVEFYLIDLKSRFPIDRSKYYLSYSGGKDSHFLYWFIKEYLRDDKIKVVSVNTYMEHPQISARMYKYADVVLLPEMKPMEIKQRYGSPEKHSERNEDGIVKREKDAAYWFFVGVQVGLVIVALAVIVDFLINFF